MTLIFPPNAYQTVTHIAGASYTDGEALLTLGVRSVGDSSAADAAVAVAQAWVQSGIAGFMPGDESIPLVEAYNETETGAATTLITGSGPGSQLPSSMAVLVEKRTAVRGRRAQGRLFVPHVAAESRVSNAGDLEPSLVADLQDTFDAFLVDLQTSDFFAVVLQNEEGITPALDPPPEVTRLLVDGKISTQRRRGRR